jgi:hypothetical protein
VKRSVVVLCCVAGCHKPTPSGGVDAAPVEAVSAAPAATGLNFHESMTDGGIPGIRVLFSDKDNDDTVDFLGLSRAEKTMLLRTSRSTDSSPRIP